MIRMLPWCLMALVSVPAVAGVLPGRPLLHSYTADETKTSAVHYSLAMDPDGRIFTAGTDRGVLVYDGNGFATVPMPANKAAQAVVAGEDGRIYVLGDNTFGWLQRTPVGGYVYEELMDRAQVPVTQRRMGILAEPVALPDSIAFRGDTGFYRLKYGAKEFSAWPSDTTVRRLYGVDGTVYAWVRDKGLVTLTTGVQQLVPGGDTFSASPVVGVLKRDGWLLVVARNGFYRLTATALTKLADPDPAATPEAAAREVVALSDGTLEVGTSDGHLIQYDAQYHVINRIALKPNQVEGMQVDRDGALWVATTGELVRVALPSPWSVLGAEQGVKEMVLDTAWYDGRLWTAGRGGVQAVSTDGNGTTTTEAMPWFGQQDAYALASTPAGLLVGDVTGVYVLDAGAKEPRRLYEKDQALASQILVSSRDSNVAYAKSSAELIVLRVVDGHWQRQAVFPFGGMDVGAVVENAPGELWLTDANGAPQRWRLDSTRTQVIDRHTFDREDGLDLQDGGSWINSLGGQLYVSTGNTVYRWSGKRFDTFVGQPFTLTDRPGNMSIEDTAIGAFAVVGGSLWYQPRGGQWHALDTGSPYEEINSVRLDGDGVVRLGYNGVLQFDPKHADSTANALKVGFADLMVGKGDGAPVSISPSGGTEGAQVPNGGVIETHFGAVSLDSPVQYRTRIAGYLDQWTDWSDQRVVRYRAERPGDFRLQVQARTMDGRTAESTLAYRVMPAWYQRADVRIGALLIALGLLALGIKEIVRRRTVSINELNRELEATVAKRSHELAEAQQELASTSTIDRLTEMPNRRAADEVLRREWVRCLDYQAPLSVLLIELDNIRHLNDAGGYLQGDELLKTMAYRLKELYDPDRELLARYEASKFVLLLPGTGKEEAARRAEAIREYLQAKLAGSTSTIGVGAAVPSTAVDHRVLLQQVESALLKAKKGGTNRVGVADAAAA